MTFTEALALEGVEPCPRHELRPCPFCGGDAYLVRKLNAGCEEWKDDPDAEVWRYWAVCRTCAAEGPWCKSGALGAAQGWNRRERLQGAAAEHYGNWLAAEVTVRGLREEVERLLAALRWRTVEKEPPPLDVTVLVRGETAGLALLQHKDGWWSDDGICWESGSPSDRWLPVPEETT